MDVRFDILHVSDAVCDTLVTKKGLSAVLSRTKLHDVRVAPRVDYGTIPISGLKESYGLGGRWSVAIEAQGAVSVDWGGFSGESNMEILPEGQKIFVRIDAGGLSASQTLEALAKLIEFIEVAGQDSTVLLDVDSGAPVEIYYRPPLGFYDDPFLLSGMDGDTLAQLERRLIE